MGWSAQDESEKAKDEDELLSRLKSTHEETSSALGALALGKFPRKRRSRLVG